MASLTYQETEQYLLSKPEAYLDYPVGDEIKVFKVKHKMFATLAIGKMGKGDKEGLTFAENDWRMNLKCDADEAVMLRNTFPAVIPGYHMNKKLWNTIILDGSMPQGELERMMDNSFMLVVSNMVNKDQQSILRQL